MSTTIPRFMVAAPSSGSGKTVVTCALLRALARRGLACAAFKCGPDYIDPLFHRRVVGARSGNLDGFFTDAPTLRALLARGAAGADVAVLEGVMGFYDGMAPGVADASSYQVARDTETPVVLVVNGRGASLSLAAVIRGIAEFLPCANVRGVVLNKTSAAACAYAAPAIEKHTGVAVLGNIPADEAFSLKKLAIDGRDVIALGVPQGPLVGLALSDALDAVMDERSDNEACALRAFIEGWRAEHEDRAPL